MFVFLNLQNKLQREPLITLIQERWRAYLWHMNFFPSTSKVTSHNCWASKSCFSPKTCMKKKRLERVGAQWGKIRNQRQGRKSMIQYNHWQDYFQILASILSQQPPLAWSFPCLTMCDVVSQWGGAVIGEVLLLWVAVGQRLPSSSVPILPWLGAPGDCAPPHSIHLKWKHIHTCAKELHSGQRLFQALNTNLSDSEVTYVKLKAITDMTLIKSLWTTQEQPILLI